MIKKNINTSLFFKRCTTKLLNEIFKKDFERNFNNDDKCISENCENKSMKNRLLCYDHRMEAIWDLTKCCPEDIRDFILREKKEIGIKLFKEKLSENSSKEEIETANLKASEKAKSIKNSIFNNEISFYDDITDDIKGEAILQQVGDFQLNLMKKRKFEMNVEEKTTYKFRGRNIKCVERDNQKHYYFTNRHLGKEKDKLIHFRHQERIKDIDKNSICQIQKDLNKYYLLIHNETEVEEFNDRQGIAALDPGIRKFQTLYDDYGRVVQFGNENFQKRIKKKFNKIDKLNQLKENANHKTKYNMKKKIAKNHQSVRGIVNDLHNQVASYLTKSYNVVFLPTFDTRQMKKDLPSSVNRMIDVFSHYRFKMKLLEMAKRRNSQVFIVDEFKTSKTCGNCGGENNIGCLEHWQCEICKFHHERDINSARNIMLRSLTMMFN